MVIRSLASKRIALAGVVVLVAVVVVTFAATISSGFYTDDYTYLEYARRLSVPE